MYPVIRPLFLTVVLFVLSLAIAHAEIGKAATENPRLINSSSPYLKAHSRDLVRWYAWEEATFERARKLDLPLMVSFGYNACHWCHVMQETHFNNEDIAKTINEKFVPVLVDRERRTALDELYLLVTEALTQQSGWPNTVFIHPDQKPFYATTFVLPERFTRILAATNEAWQNDRASLVKEAGKLSDVLNQFATRKEQSKQITPEVLATNASAIAERFDPFYGGTGDTAKFYRQPLLMFLLQQMERDGDAAIGEALERTLQAIMAGGVQDHLAGGFHRYSVDPAWLVPHFEKMLYDQAQLAELYAQAYRVTGGSNYAYTARKTLDYILADLTSPEGGFYSTRDADSEGEEGTFYVWTTEQLEEVLGQEDAKFAKEVFGIIPEGDFADKVILNFYNSADADPARLDGILSRLAVARGTRQRPVRDEKIVAAWNGLTIAAMARGGVVLNEPKYLEAATKAAQFIWASMRSSTGDLMRIAFAGVSEIEAELDDFAQVARGFLFLYDATADRVWLMRTGELVDEMLERFQDPVAGDFYATQKTTGFGRFKSRRDIDIASGNGAALDVIGRMARRTQRSEYKRQAERISATLSGIALSSPEGGTSILAAADRFVRGETGMVQYAGDGNVQARVIPGDDGRSATVRLTIAPGWHVNAQTPLEEFLVPTRLEMFANGKTASAKTRFPQSVTKSLTFNKRPLALLEGVVDIEVAMQDSTVALPATAIAAIDVQTCSDRICLLPETLHLQFAWPSKTANSDGNN